MEGFYFVPGASATMKLSLRRTLVLHQLCAAKRSSTTNSQHPDSIVGVRFVLY
jgi:hypothetical protein